MMFCQFLKSNSLNDGYERTKSPSYQANLELHSDWQKVLILALSKAKYPNKLRVVQVRDEQ